jgi:hypothetical protein
MHKILSVLLFLCASASFSQNITIKGKITDNQDFPLESATIYLTSVKDSSVVDYTISNKNGNWELKTHKILQPVYLKVSYTGLADYKQEFATIEEDRDFGTVKLADKSTELNEVIIESEIPPIRIKSDTLEFNASSFKVRPDANVESLLKQLPGVEIDAEGKITVNGKEVNQILVNGKPFFDKDGKIALQNLPAEIINKVQVTDTKTKKEELSGQKATGDNASINLTIDEEKNKGLFGRFMGGFGSNDRYESSALLNYFKGSRKISVLASSNNINSTGFSMNEIFDSMGGGRNMSVYMNSDNGSFGINGMQFGGNQGITKSDIIGLNYADEWFKGFEPSMNYFYTSANNENQNRTSQVNYQQVSEDDDNPGTFIDKSYSTNSKSRTENDKYAHNFNTEFNFKIDSTATIYFAPKFVKAHSNVESTSEQFSTRLADQKLLNESTAHRLDENDNASFSSNLVFSKSFVKKGRTIDFNFENDNQKDDGTNLNQSLTNKYKYPGDNVIVTEDNRDQLRYNRKTADRYTAGVEYFEPITDSMQLKIGATYELKKSLEDRDGYDFDTATGQYSSYNDALSNYLSSSTSTVTPSAGINVNRDKFYFRADLGTRISQFNNHASYMGSNYDVNKNYVLPSVDLGMNYRMSKSKSIWIGYDYEVDFPQPNQILPVTDVSNALYTSVGNPDLDPEKYHNINISYRDYDYATRSGYSFYAGGNYYDNQVVSSTTTDGSAKSNTEYRNVSGAYYSWLGGNWSKSIKKDAHTYRFSIGVNGGYSVNKGFINNELYDTKALRLNPRANFTYEYGELLTINPSYNFTYTDNSYSINTINTASNIVHKFNLQTTTYWPKHVVFGNDFGYTYNSNNAPGFKKDFYLWNTSLGYNFLNDNLLFKVKVYDMLNQNIGTSRSIGTTSITNQENTVLKRYIMFSLTFKLDKFGTKKKEDNNDHFWWF